MKTSHIIFFAVLLFFLFRKRTTATTNTTTTVGALTANALLRRDTDERIAQLEERLNELENSPLA